jgi:hypothetical protein
VTSSSLRHRYSQLQIVFFSHAKRRLAFACMLKEERALWIMRVEFLVSHDTVGFTTLERYDTVSQSRTRLVDNARVFTFPASLVARWATLYHGKTFELGKMEVVDEMYVDGHWTRRAVVGDKEVLRSALLGSALAQIMQLLAAVSRKNYMRPK